MTPISVLLCALLGANAVSNLIAEHALGEPVRAAAAPVYKAEKTSAPEPRSKDGSRMVADNMFCRACTQDEADATIPNARTALPLRLIATNLSTSESHSFASVLNTQSQRQGAYRVGQEIPGAGVVQRIGWDYLELLNEETSRIERVDFDSGVAKLESRPSSKAASARGGAGNELVEQYVRQVSETHFEVDRKLIGRLQESPLLGGAQARPVSKDGKMSGVKLFAVRSTGLAHAMGLRNGDTIIGANGVKLQSMEAALELMGRIKRLDHWSIEILRGGKAVNLQVDLQ